MTHDWGTGSNSTAPVTTSSFNQGRSTGKGRGFGIIKAKTDSSNVGNSTNNEWGTENNSTTNNDCGTGNNASSSNNEWGTGNNASSSNNEWGTGNNASSSNNEWGTGNNASSSNNEWGTSNNASSSKNDDWGTNNNASSSKNDDWGTNNNASSSKNDNWGNDNQSSGQNFDDAEENDNNRRGGGGRGRGGRGRGGRGRGGDRNEGGGRGGGRRRNDDDNDNDRDNEGVDDENGDEEKKAPVTYIPPERSMDDAELFGSGVSVGINFNKYDNVKVEVSGEDVPPPIEQFNEANLRVSLLENVTKSGYKKPTPVQKHAIPIMMAGRDVMACAQTGSGKTAAYLIPIIHKLLEANEELKKFERGCEPQVIIMAPTRELVTQIEWEAQKFAKGTIIKSISVYGGVATMHQVRKCENGSHIIVATPGRLWDFVERGRIKFSSIRFVVLDEADRMLDQGFLSSMENILRHDTMVPSTERQTVMFSATFPSDVQNLAAQFMQNYLFLRVGIVGGACENVEQNFYEVEKKQKRSKLHELLDLDGGTSLKKKTLVFVETKKTADFIAAYMSDKKFPSTSIHGDREQKEREIALGDFKSGRMPILVATSVAARGLDIPQVAHVINYDLPKNIEDYVHRIGRTGRMGNEGKATSFYDRDQDSSLAQDLVKMLMQANKEVPDFLKGEEYGFDAGQTSDFGGCDIRGNNSAAEPTESW